MDWFSKHPQNTSGKNGRKGSARKRDENDWFVVVAIKLRKRLLAPRSNNDDKSNMGINLRDWGF